MSNQAPIKPRMSLLPPQGIQAAAEAMTAGVANHGEGITYGTLTDELDSLGRHYIAILRGEHVDPDSGLTHASHMAARALKIAEMEAHKVHAPAEPETEAKTCGDCVHLENRVEDSGWCGTKSRIAFDWDKACKCLKERKTSGTGRNDHE